MIFVVSTTSWSSSNSYNISSWKRQHYSFIWAVFKLHTEWSNAQRVSAQTTTILPITAATWTARTTLITWYTRRKLICSTKILKNFWLTQEFIFSLLLKQEIYVTSQNDFPQFVWNVSVRNIRITNKFKLLYKDWLICSFCNNLSIIMILTLISLANDFIFCNNPKTFPNNRMREFLWKMESKSKMNMKTFFASKIKHSIFFYQLFERTKTIRLQITRS